jgi:hypothetical protein
MRVLPPSSCEIRCLFSSEGYHVVFNFFWPFLTADGDSCYRGFAFVLESRFIKRETFDNVQSKCPNNDGELLASNLRTTNFLHDYLRTAFGNRSVFGFGPMSAKLSSLIILSRSSFLGTQLRVFWTTYPVRVHCFIHNYEQTKLWSENSNRRDHLGVLGRDWNMVLTTLRTESMGMWIQLDCRIVHSVSVLLWTRLLSSSIWDREILVLINDSSSWRIAHVLRGVSYTITETISVMQRFSS